MNAEPQLPALRAELLARTQRKWARYPKHRPRTRSLHTHWRIPPLEMFTARREPCPRSGTAWPGMASSFWCSIG